MLYIQVCQADTWEGASLQGEQQVMSGSGELKRKGKEIKGKIKWKGALAQTDLLWNEKNDLWIPPKEGKYN